MKKWMNTVIWVVALVLVVGAAYSFTSKNNDTPQSGSETSGNDPFTSPAGSSPSAGDEKKDKELAADFTLKDLDGKEVKLSDFRGKMVILNFWATWCPPCRQEIPDFEEVNKSLSSDGNVVMLAVNLTDGQRETPDKVKNFVKSNDMKMRILMDQGTKVANLYKVYAIPTTYFIGREGEVLNKQEGATNKEFLLKMINQFSK